MIPADSDNARVMDSRSEPGKRRAREKEPGKRARPLFVFAWLRLRSGSVWTGMLLQASHNLWIQGFFDRVTIDNGWRRWFTTEFGAALALVAVVVAYSFWRLRNQLHQPMEDRPPE